MNARARRIAIAALAGLNLLAGCQSPGPILGRQTTIGSLKTSVSQLEFKNDQLEKKLADLRTENRRYEERLTQEQAANDELATRLDNARGLLGRGQDVRTGSPSRAATDDDSALETPAPKVRRSRSSRKPPSVLIPGGIEPARPSDGDLGDYSAARTGDRAPSRRPSDERWLPVARGVGAGQGIVK